VCLLRHAIPKRVRPSRAHAIPANLRNADVVGKSPDNAADPSESIDIALLAVVQEHLEAHANAEERDTVAQNPLVQGAEEIGFAERLHGGAGGPNTRKDDPLSSCQILRM